MSVCLTEFSWNLTVKISVNLTTKLQAVSHIQLVASSASSFDSEIKNISIFTIRTLHNLLNKSLKLKFATPEGRGTAPQNYSRRPCPLWTNGKTQLQGTRKFSHLTAGYGPYDSPLHRAKRWPKQNWTNITTHTQNTLSRSILRKLASTHRQRSSPYVMSIAVGVNDWSAPSGYRKQ